MAMFQWLLRYRSAIDPAAIEEVVLASQGGGILVVPVRALKSRGGFGSESANSMNPSLSIGPDGLRFRIIRETHLPFAQIDKVHLRKGLFGGAHLVIYGNRRMLLATFSNMGTAKAVLAAFPATVPLSNDAATVRNWTANDR